MARKIKTVMHGKYPYGQIFANCDEDTISITEIAYSEVKEIEFTLDEAKSLLALLPKLISEAENFLAKEEE